MASHFGKEMDTAFQILVGSVFLAPESSPPQAACHVAVRVVAETFLCLLRKNKTKQNKNISVEKQGNIFFFLQRFENGENKNKTSREPGYCKEFSFG